MWVSQIETLVLSIEPYTALDPSGIALEWPKLIGPVLDNMLSRLLRTFFSSQSLNATKASSPQLVVKMPELVDPKIIQEKIDSRLCVLMQTYRARTAVLC